MYSLPRRYGMDVKIIDKILSGKANLDDIKTLESIPSMISGSTICALGDAAAMPVESFIKHYKNEFLRYIDHEIQNKDRNFNFDATNNKEFILHKK